MDQMLKLWLKMIFIIFLYYRSQCDENREKMCSAFQCSENQIRNLMLHYIKYPGNETLLEKYKANKKTFDHDPGYKYCQIDNHAELFINCVTTQPKYDTISEKCVLSNNINKDTCIFEKNTLNDELALSVYECINIPGSSTQQRLYNSAYFALTNYETFFENLVYYNYNFKNIKKIACISIKGFFQSSETKGDSAAFIKYIYSTLYNQLVQILEKFDIFDITDRTIVYYLQQRKGHTVVIISQIRCIFDIYIDQLNKNIEKNILDDTCPDLDEIDFDLQYLIENMYPYDKTSEDEIKEYLNKNTITVTKLKEQEKGNLTELTTVNIEESKQTKAVSNSAIYVSISIVILIVIFILIIIFRKKIFKSLK